VWKPSSACRNLSLQIPLSMTPTKDSQWNRPITTRSPRMPIWPPPHLRRHPPPRRLYWSKPAEATGQPYHHPPPSADAMVLHYPAEWVPARRNVALHRPVSGGRRRPIPTSARPPPCPVTPTPPMPLSLYYPVPAPAAAASICSSA
jgi:hypothetical protein